MRRSYRVIGLVMFAFVAIALIGGGCAPSDSNPTSTESRTSDDLDESPDTDTIRKQFEVEMNRRIRLATQALEADSDWLWPFDEDKCAEMSMRYSSVVDRKDRVAIACSDLMHVITLSDSVSFDVKKTDSIISPYVAELWIDFGVTKMYVDSDGNQVDEAGAAYTTADTFHLTWQYVDNEWDLTEITAIDPIYTGVGLLLFRVGSSPTDLPRNPSSPTTTLKALPAETTTTATTDIPGAVAIEDLCDEADSSPSGEYFIAGLSIWAAENLTGSELDNRFNAVHHAIMELWEDQSCNTEHARTIINEAIPFLLPAEG